MYPLKHLPFISPLFLGCLFLTDLMFWRFHTFVLQDGFFTKFQTCVADQLHTWSDYILSVHLFPLFISATKVKSCPSCKNRVTNDSSPININTPTTTSQPAQPAQPAKPQITDFVKRNCHKKLHEEHKRNATDAQEQTLASTLAELWKPLVHPIEERVFVTDKGERFEVPEGQMRWKRPLGKKVVLIDTDTRLDASDENTMLNECPLYYPTIPGRTAGHLNHYLYGITHRLPTQQ